jgi:hypothetical protein
MQLYFYDIDDNSVAHRIKRSPGLDENSIRYVRGILKWLNPYVQVFISLGNIQKFEECTIELSTSIDAE